MKQNPKDEALRENLEAGKLSKEGFLGDDDRQIEQIVEDDAIQLAEVNLNAQEVADAMRALTRLGLEGQGQEVNTKEFKLVVEEYMGYMSCPYRDNRRAAKRSTRATLKSSGETMTWTDMGIHLIQAHGFFQGKGSPYRLEPLKLAAFLQLIKGD
jgi:hypothetical protein